MTDLITISDNQIGTVRNTVAKDLNNPEFDLFIALCKRTGLDPFRRQIIPIVFSKDKPDKRKMETIVTRDGYRCIASRCGNYRPKSEAANFTYDDKAKSKTNPAGIISCSVILHVQDKQGTWHPVYGEAYWDEYAPIEKEWNWGAEKGQKVYTGKETLSGNWEKMPRVMIEKCAESAALRAGWPEEFAGLYGEEEMARAMLDDRTASQVFEDEQQQRREKAINYKGKIPANFGNGIEYIPIGEYGDRWLKFLREQTPQSAIRFQQMNQQCLNEYWAKDANGALEVKKEFERLQAEAEMESA